MDRLFIKEKQIKSLISKHKFFDTLIKKKIRRLSSDDLEIGILKKKKLKIKDLLSKLATN